MSNIIKIGGITETPPNPVYIAVGRSGAVTSSTFTRPDDASVRCVMRAYLGTMYFQGSNDGSSWTTIASTHHGVYEGDYSGYNGTNSSYAYYRIYYSGSMPDDTGARAGADGMIAAEYPTS